jgi:hypothetical protein
MKLSGHASVSSLMPYSHLDQDEVLEKALEILNQGVSRAGSYRRRAGSPRRD